MAVAKATEESRPPHQVNSVLVIAAVERATGKPLPVAAMPRRAGDPAALVAGADRIRATLGWRPLHDDLDFIVRSALAWERRLMAKAA